jgi:hypothetical protein
LQWALLQVLVYQPPKAPQDQQLTPSLQVWQENLELLQVLFLLLLEVWLVLLCLSH